MTTTDIALPSHEPIEGLEDYDPATDARTPSIVIKHKEGKLMDSLSNERFDSIDVILVAQVKGRTLWDAEVSEGKSFPLCQSYDFKSGIVNPKNPSSFPWKASGFSLKDYLIDEDDGCEPLACADCALKAWDTHPKRNAPWCSEEHTFVALVPADNYSPVLLKISRAGLTNSNNYVMSFARKGVPLFTALTRITLDVQRRGDVDFAKPIFTRLGDTDPDVHELCAETGRRIREFLRTPRTFVPESEEEGAVAPKPVTVTAKKKAAAKAEVIDVESTEDDGAVYGDDEPF